MKRILSVLLCAALTFAMVTAFAETLTGTADGFMGPVSVSVEVTDGKITQVTVTEQNETPAIAGVALEQIPAAIVEKGSADVDVYSGATYTSNAIIQAVSYALNPELIPEAKAEEAAEPVVLEAAEAYIGFGYDNSGRVGPGKDDKEAQVYSFNQVMAQVIFDQEGKILFANLDQLEVATPNYDGDGMPHFSGFPGQAGYNYDSDHDGKIDSTVEPTGESYLEEIAGWMTKRERGDSYRMNTGTWSAQMNTFEQLFVGKTVEEVEVWFSQYTSDRNGRPLKDGSTNEEDKTKYDALSDEDKAMLADVTTTATMSLNDAHGNILAALKDAYAKRLPVTADASAVGLGFNFVGRLGPGADDKEVPVFSFNEVYASTLFDADGRIAQVHVDILEVATPNYDGDGMPHFSGYPGQGGYNYDSDHDGKVDSVLEPTNEDYLAEIAGWMTKRERGDSYRMTTGTWSAQMNTFEQLFVGMTVAEVEEWFALYTSDRNGRPLKDGSTNEEDKTKYDALSDEDKAMLADVTTTAAVSLNAAHG
ncbi:MAG: FMN-binding protein, partial [Clostridiales bacterium]|nr:FMN-binding protein [Clostridiales bacterium]